MRGLGVWGATALWFGGGGGSRHLWATIVGLGGVSCSRAGWSGGCKCVGTGGFEWGVGDSVNVILI